MKNENTLKVAIAEVSFVIEKMYFEKLFRKNVAEIEMMKKLDLL